MKFSNKLLVIGFVLIAFVVSTPLNAQKAKPKPKASSSTPKKSGGSSNPFGGSTSTTSNPFGGGTASTPPSNNSKTTTQSTTGSNPFGGGGSTTTSNDPFGGSAANKTNQPPQAKPTGGFNKSLPITVQKSAGGDPLTDTLKPSLRNGSAVYTMVKDRTPLAYRSEERRVGKECA